jgi:hypothetical protein
MREQERSSGSQCRSVDASGAMGRWVEGGGWNRLVVLITVVREEKGSGWHRHRL